MATYPYAYPSAAAYPPPASGFFPAYSFPSSAAYPPPLSPDPNRPPPAPPNHGDPHHCHLLYQRPTQIPNFGTGCTPYRRPISRAPQLPRSEPIDRPCVSAWPSSPHPVPPPPASPHTPKSPMELANHDLAALGATDLIRVSATIPRGAPGPWTPPPPPSGAPSSSTSGTPPFPPVQGVPDPSPLIPGADLSSSGSPPSAPPPPLLHPVVLGLRSGLRAPELAPRRAQQPPPAPSGPDGFSQAPPPLAASMAAVAPAWPLYSGSPSSSLRPSGMSSYAASTILTEMEPVAVLSHPRLDSAPEVFDNMPTSRPGAEESIATAQARVVQAAATISKDMPRAVLDLKRRLDEQQARDRTSFDKLRGELAKLTSMATQLAVSIGKQTTSAIPGSSPLGVIGTAPVAPKVFDKRPTPSSGHGNQASTTTAPTISVGFIPSSGSTTLAASAPWLFSAVVGSSASSPSDASTAAYVAPSVIDEMPQSYGFSNLTRQSILLADGTEHSYFTLPADYHLEQAVSEPVFDVYADETEDCSNVFVDVLADSFGQSNAFVDVLPRNSVQQPYEVEQRQSHQAPKCFSNPNFSPERPIVGTDIQQPLHLSIDEELQGDEKMLGEKSVCQSAIEHSCLNFLWDPGDARLHTLFTTSARATKFPSTHAYKCAMIHIPVGQFGASRAPSFQCAIMLSAVFGLGWTALHASALFPLVAPCSTGKYRCLPSFAMSKQQWNPGIDLFSYKKLHLFSWIPPSAILILQQLHYKNISSMWDCSLEKGKQVQWDPGIAISNLWIFISQPVDLKQFWSQLLLQRHSCSWKIAQEKEKVMVGLNPKQWTFSFNAMPYCQICEKCIAMSYQLYWHEDINFNEIHLWLIHFQPP